MKPRWVSATGRLVTVAVCRLVRFFDFELCERRELMRLRGNVANAWDRLSKDVPDVVAAKRSLEYANKQAGYLLQETETEGLVLGCTSNYPRRIGS